MDNHCSLARQAQSPVDREHTVVLATSRCYHGISSEWVWREYGGILVFTTRTTLLARIEDRDNTVAWGEFYDLYFPLLFRYARARSLSRADAEDVAQQCMASISRHIGQFEYSRDKGGFKSWLRTIVNNKVIDQYRKRQQVLDGVDHTNRVDGNQPTPDELWDQQWHKEHLRYCLERVREELPEKTYQAFDLFALQEKPASEVSHILGLTENHIWVIKSRVLKRLRIVAQQHFGSDFVALD